MMGRLWTGMVLASVVWGAVLGRGEQVGAAALTGAAAGVELGVRLAGMLCLWSGVMEVMERAGLAEKLARLLAPVLGRLFPGSRGDREAMDNLSANVSANLLGLGNAATPLGLRAARAIAGAGAEGDLAMLIVCNTASIQLIPTTVGALRAAAGSGTPFDILPAVWLTSALALGVGILACKLFSRWVRG